MKTTLNAQGQIDLPPEIRQADHLVAGDAFDVERLAAGHYLLARQPSGGSRFTVATGDDGLPVIRVSEGGLSASLVKELESGTP